MTPSLAHHTPPKLEVDDRELFRWDAKSVDQFILVDPLNQGWKLVFAPKEGNVPAHLRLKAPLVWEKSAGPVFVIARKNVSSDHVVHTYHDIPEEGMAGNVDRYAGPEDYMASCRERGQGNKKRQKGALRSFVSDAGLTEDLILQIEDVGELSYTVSRCDSGLVSVQGCAKVALHAESHTSEDSQKVGFMAYLEDKGSNGGEEIRIFDFYVERVR